MMIVEIRNDEFAFLIETNAARWVQVPEHMRLAAKHAQRNTLSTEQLDAVIPGVCDRNFASSVYRHVPRVTKLALLLAMLAKGSQELTFHR